MNDLAPKRALHVACVVALFLGIAGVAHAQDGPAATFTIGAGAEFSPSYFGSDDYELGPAATARIDHLRLPGGLSFGTAKGGAPTEGFGFRGTARYIGERDASDHSELEGLEDVDASVELGLGLGYDQRNWRAFGTVSYGVIGHNAWVGELGADALFHPAEGLTVNLGPRVDFGDKRFMRTYYGISADESAASGLEEYEPSAGIVSVGVELGARYAFSERWGLEGKATYERLVGDAADSPIVDEGTADQYRLRLGITRQISLDF